MNSIKKCLLLSFAMCMLSTSVFAWISPDRNKKPGDKNLTVHTRMDCIAPEAQTLQEVNNVRARLTSGGDVWWDGQNGSYIVPKPAPGEQGVSSIFAGGVWIGGFDPSNNQKVAGSTYRSSTSTDYFTGPLTETGETDALTCEQWDQFFEVSGDDARKAVRTFDDPLTFNCDSIPDDVRYWPGIGNPYFTEEYDFDLPDAEQGLGSFWDQDGDGFYDPCMGDFPIIDIRGCEPATRAAARELIPDEMIFWIYNDAGGTQTETFGEPIRMEVQVQAFGYVSNDAINDMTFQRYKLINRARTDIRDCYFAMWTDPDLGCANDDYIGCDVDASLMYLYNEDAVDGDDGENCAGGVATYGDEVPMLGVDYFRGPLSPKLFQDGPDGDTIFVTPPLGTGLVDTLLEEGMTSFVYHLREGDPRQLDPRNDEEYYNYLSGLWRDGTPITFGGDGLNLGSTDTIDYVFPGAPNDPDGWSMCTANLPMIDPRTVQATGPLLLQPGAVNELIIGVVWVPDVGYPCPDLSQILAADELAQGLFDNCFDFLDGPDAPDVCTIELDREIILVLSNDTLKSNNKFLSYEEVDIFSENGVEDSTYNFEGYLVYQLENPVVSPQEYRDIDKARLVGQVDVRNGVNTIYNWTSEKDPFSDEPLWQFNAMVEGADAGLSNTFRVTQDAFASVDDVRLINHTEYYFSVVAYAHNNYKNFDFKDATGQQRAFLEGRKNIKQYTAVPRPIVYENLNSFYGDGPVITRLSGVGVGENNVELADGMHDKILSGDFDGEIEYQRGAGPVSISVYNPLDIINTTYELEVIGTHDDSPLCRLEEGAIWQMTDVNTEEVIVSENTLEDLNEQLVPQYGFSVSMGQAPEPGDDPERTNGAISVTLNYADQSAGFWYSGVPDEAIGGFSNFLKTAPDEDDNGLDPNESFSDVGDGFFVPYFLTDWRTPNSQNQQLQFVLTPSWVDKESTPLQVRSKTGLDDLNNVDLVFTSDKSKWSRCVVVESANKWHLAANDFPGNTENIQSIDGATSFDLRESPSVDKDGNPDGTGVGMGWFPGYAIDVESGKRLNVFFSENSIYNESFVDLLDDGQPIGADMIFNPTSQLSAQVSAFSVAQFVLGGGHNVYVTRQEYDECAYFEDKFSSPLFVDKIDPLSLITWTSMSLLAQENELLPYSEGLIPNDLTVKLRVNNPYNKERDLNTNNLNQCNSVGDLPKYRIEFRDVQSEELLEEEYAGALAEVNVVPNPYYAYSAYEIDQFKNTIKITNLPERCDVTIYSLDGKFIRQFNRDESPNTKGGANPGVLTGQTNPDIEWNLKNYAGIPVASGVYIIHISAPELGEERSIKWFGINRKFDPRGL